MVAQAAILTAPYKFASSGAPGISIALPLPGQGGAIGFDFVLDTLSALLTRLKVSPNSTILLATSDGGVFAESAGCDSTDARCASVDADVRAAIRREISGAVGRSERRSERLLEPCSSASVMRCSIGWWRISRRCLRYRFRRCECDLKE